MLDPGLIGIKNLQEYDKICSKLNTEVNILNDWREDYVNNRVPNSIKIVQDSINNNKVAKGDSECLSGQYFKGQSYILNEGDFRMFRDNFQKLLTKIVE